ncbi:MAG: glycosyltransferase [Prevotella sp.]|nr:glycosyltransferase [Prevotella sp.]
MINSLSILIPCFNVSCFSLVRQLHEQAMAIEGLTFEIIVADDGSTDRQLVASNEMIRRLAHCAYIIRQENVGRAAIRNFLAREAHFDQLLFVDSGVEIHRRTFLIDYLEQADEHSVVAGGVSIPAQNLTQRLKYRYEKEHENRHTVARRQQQPYQSFRSCNFMIPKRLMRTFPFPEQLKRYGYEDVLLGRAFEQHQVPVKHVDNPIAYVHFESNKDFLKKTEEAIDNLKAHVDLLRDYSHLASVAEYLRTARLQWLIRIIFRVMRKQWRRNLCGDHPSLRIFAMYKLGYYFE